MAKKSKRRPIAVVDAETDPFKYGRVPEPFVWGFFDGLRFLTFDTAQEMMAFLEGERFIIYAHNGGRFDWHYLKDFIPRPSEIMLINGRIAKFTVGECEFRDSFNMIPVSLKVFDKDKINYELMEKEKRDIPKNREEILSYLRMDCVQLYTAVSKFIDLYGLHLTQATSSMKSWQKMTKLKPPRSDEEFYSDFRRYYRGGRVQAFATGDISTVFSVYDINSAYPYAMLHNHPLSLEYSSNFDDVLPEGTDYGPDFFTVEAVSKGAFATDMPDRNGIVKTFYPTDDVVREYHVTGWELMVALQTQTATIHCVKERHTFEGLISFGQYIRYFYELRKEAKKNKDKFTDVFAKLQMNSLYGKFAADPRRYERYRLVDRDKALEHYIEEYDEKAERIPRGSDMSEFYMDDSDEDWYYSGDFSYAAGLLSRKLAGHEQRYYNVATGASITGFVRAYLWAAICAVGTDMVLYCDTDSIAVRGKTHNVRLSDELGAWKHEGLFDRAIILRRKTYAFRRDHADYEKMRSAERDSEKRKAIERWKTAHKGLSDVSPAEMARVAKGEVIKVASDIPVYSAYGAPRFQERTLRLDF